METTLTKVVTDIRDKIEQNKNAYTKKKYDTLLGELSMNSRRNMKVLSTLDNMLYEEGIEIWIGQEQIHELKNVDKGKIITFRESNQKTTQSHKLEPKEAIVPFAGTIPIAQENSGIKPYPHQNEAFAQLSKSILNNDNYSGLLVLPTGGGKTLTAGYWTAKNIINKGAKVLWIAHRHALLDQALKTFTDKLAFKDIFPKKEKVNFRVLSSAHDRSVNIKTTDDLIIASKDSLNSGFEYLKSAWFKHQSENIFLVIDEAHHATAKTYRKLIDKLQEYSNKLQILGLTATPTRTAESEKGLLQKVFPNDIVYKVDLTSLIRQGILAEPKLISISTQQDFRKSFTEQQIQKINKLDISKIDQNIANDIINNSKRNQVIVEHYKENKTIYKQTLVFALNVTNAIALNTLFQAEGIHSDFVVSTIQDAYTGASRSPKENTRITNKFREGELDVLINVNILTEGTDLPNVQTVFLTRPTTSPSLMTQMVGRGLRGTKAGGTKEAYIVNFIDKWQDNIAWVSPEKLEIDEFSQFNETQGKREQQLMKLVAIKKMEEFAILAGEVINQEVKEGLENISFIQRIPIGIYYFEYLKETEQDEFESKICEILVYDNLVNAYENLLQDLPSFVEEHKIEEANEHKLNEFTQLLEKKYFNNIEKYPAYKRSDIKDLLSYYLSKEYTPTLILFSEREAYDISKIAQHIWDSGIGGSKKKEYLDNEWEQNKEKWHTFFNFDYKHFLSEIDVCSRKIANPELYQTTATSSKPIYEKRDFIYMSLSELRDIDPAYEQRLRDQVFRKYTNKNGNYFSAQSGYTSSKRNDFQIDHIHPISKGGLTILSNLQLLTKKENAKKGNKEGN